MPASMLNIFRYLFFMMPIWLKADSHSQDAGKIVNADRAAFANLGNCSRGFIQNSARGNCLNSTSTVEFDFTVIIPSLSSNSLSGIRSAASVNGNRIHLFSFKALISLSKYAEICFRRCYRCVETVVTKEHFLVCNIPARFLKCSNLPASIRRRHNSSFSANALILSTALKIFICRPCSDLLIWFKAEKCLPSRLILPHSLHERRIRHVCHLFPSGIEPTHFEAQIDVVDTPLSKANALSCRMGVLHDLTLILHRVYEKVECL